MPEIQVDSCKKGVQIQVRVQPRASRNTVRIAGDGKVHISITAPAVDNAANIAVCDFMAQILGVGKKRIHLASGKRSRDKMILVEQGNVLEIKDKIAVAAQ